MPGCGICKQVDLYQNNFSNMKISIIEKLTLQDHIETAKIEENYFEKEFIASPEVTQSWYEHNNDTYVVARNEDTGLVAGHMSFIPMDDHLYELIESGDYVDTQISPEYIIRYDKPGTYKLYFCVICVAPEHRGRGVSQILMKEYAKRLLALKENGIIFSDVISDTITEDGKHFAQNVLGMDVKNSSAHGSKIMHVGGNVFYEKLNKL
jgi:GNAT superfamily N-acetyltransferase